MRTYEEIDPVTKKTPKYKNEPNPDNGLVYDFSNNPFRVGKTNKKLMPEKLNETVPKFEKGKKALESALERRRLKGEVLDIKNGYEDINTSKNACNISNNKKNWEVCKVLKEKNYISSFKAGKRNNIVLYNKVNRE